MKTITFSGVYAAPEISVIEIESQGVLCASGEQNNPFNYEDNPSWF